MFNEGRTNVQDEERSGRPSLITEGLKNRILPTVRTWLQVIFTCSHTHLEQFFGGTPMNSDEEVKKADKGWFNELAADFYVQAYRNSSHDTSA
jgi:hypothetical protein